MRSVHVPQDIASFLIGYDVIKRKDLQSTEGGDFKLSDKASLDFLCGISCSVLLHRIGIKENIASGFAFENMSTSHHDRHSSANTVFNWSNIQQDVKQFGITLDKDTKCNIITGDIDCIIRIIQQIISASNSDSNFSPFALSEPEHNDNRNETDQQSNSLSSYISSALPPIPDASIASVNEQTYKIQYKLQKNNRFFKLLVQSFCAHFSISTGDAMKILLSEKHLFSLFHQFKFSEDIMPNIKQYKKSYEQNLRANHEQNKESELTWLQVTIRKNLLSFMHDRKTEMTKFISSKVQKTKNYQSHNANENTLTGLMSNKSHNAIKHEMIYLLELFRFGLTPNVYKETHLSIVFNSFSAIHAILRALNSINVNLMSDVAKWFINDSNMLSMLAETILSLKPLFIEYDDANKKQKMSENFGKKKKILSHVGYEIWNILSMLSTNSITFLSIFDTHLIALFDNGSGDEEEEKQKYFEVVQYLFKCLQISLLFAKTNKNKTYKKHLQIVIKKLQNDRIVDFLIGHLSSHLFSRSNNALLTSPISTAPKQCSHQQRQSKVVNNPLRAHYEKMINSERNTENGMSTQIDTVSEDLVDCNAINALAQLWLTLALHLDLSQKESIMNILKKLSRSTLNSTQICCLNNLFSILHILAKNEDIEFTPKIYKCLIFHLVENHGDEEIRDIMLNNFIFAIRSLPNIPIHVFVEPLVRQTAYYGSCQLHFDLFGVIISHQRVHLKEAMLIIHLIGKICISDVKYHTSALVILIQIIKKYQSEQILQQYCSKYFKVTFSNFVHISQQQHLSQIQCTPALYEANFSKMEISIKTLIEITKIGNDVLNKMIENILKYVIKDYAELFGDINPLLKILYTALKSDTIDAAQLKSECFLSDDNEADSDALSMFGDEFMKNNKSPSNRLSTPELNDAVADAKKKYFEQLEVGSDYDEDEEETQSVLSESVDSSQMSEFEPDKPDYAKMQLRVKKDIKKSIERYRQKSTQQTEEMATPQLPKRRIKRFKYSPVAKKMIDDEMRGILKKYEHIFRVIVSAYRGKKPSGIKAATFDEHNKMHKMISFAEFNMIFDDYKVCNVLIKKNQLKGILRETAEGYGGNMCTMHNFMESLCYIAQYAKLKENNIDKAVSPKKKLRNLIFYMKRQHKECNFKPFKLWESQPPKASKPKYKKHAKSKVLELISPKKKKLLKQSQVTMNGKSMKEKIDALKKQNERLQNELDVDAPNVGLDVMNDHILNGSPMINDAKKKKKKSGKKKVRDLKYFEALYEKEMAAKKIISEKHEEYKQRKEKEFKEMNKKREQKRKVRSEQIKKNLEKTKQQKQIEKQQKAKKMAEKKKLHAIKLKKKAKKQAEERKIKKERLQKFKEQMMKKREDEIEKKRVKEMKKKVTKEEKKKIVERRKIAIEKAAERLKERELKKEEERVKEEERKSVYNKPIMDRKKSRKLALKRRETMEKREVSRRQRSLSPTKKKDKVSPSKKKSMIKRESEKQQQQMIGPNDEVENWAINKDEESRPQTQPPHCSPLKDEDVMKPETKNVKEYAMSNDMNPPKA